MICGSSASTALIWAGRWRSARSCAASCSSLWRPWVSASASASRCSAVSWVVNAFVEATPISIPARVMYDRLASRTSALVETLQMARLRVMPNEAA